MRLAHTLKSTAAMVGKTELQQAAQTVEHTLKDNALPISPVQLELLQRELNKALADFEPLLHKAATPQQTQALNSQELAALFDELESLLASNDTDCLELAEKLQGLPNTGMLIKQIESFDFKLARQTPLSMKAAHQEETRI